MYVSSSSGQNGNANAFCDFSRNLFYPSYDELIVLDVTSYTALVVFSTYTISKNMWYVAELRTHLEATSTSESTK